MSNDEKRHKERWKFKRAVLFGPDKPPKHWAYITNISNDGIFIKTNMVFSSGTELHIIIKEKDGNDCVMTGEVMRASKIPPAFSSEGKSGMGIKLTAYKEEFFNKYEDFFKV